MSLCLFVCLFVSSFLFIYSFIHSFIHFIHSLFNIIYFAKRDHKNDKTLIRKIVFYKTETLFTVTYVPPEGIYTCMLARLLDGGRSLFIRETNMFEYKNVLHMKQEFKNTINSLSICM